VVDDDDDDTDTDDAYRGSRMQVLVAAERSAGPGPSERVLSELRQPFGEPGEIAFKLQVRLVDMGAVGSGRDAACASVK
jgi:hypothetical protein